MKTTRRKTSRTPKRQQVAKADTARVPIDELAEKAVLGMVLEAALDGAHVVKPMMARLRPSSFGDIRCRAIFEAAEAVVEAGQTCDILTVRTELAKQNQLTQIGGEKFLSETADAALPRLNFDQHASRLQKLEALRLALNECAALQKAILSKTDDQAVAILREVPEQFHFLANLASGAEAHDSIVRPDPEPWPEPVTTECLLDELTAIFRRFVILPDHAAEALALWTLFTYVYECFEICPILALISPEKRCGKSTTLHLADSLTRHALVTSNVTGAALFRVIEGHKPTLLIDEFDSISNPDRKEDLRNILNAGHNRKGRVIRCDGDDNKPTAFSVFGPKMVAAIGNLPETLMDRAIKVPMRRKLANESVERLRRFNFIDTCRRCVRWARDNVANLAQARPVIPDELNDRAADNWESLLAIAAFAGEEWLDRAREAALALSGATESGNNSLGVELVHDMEAIFAERMSTRLQTSVLVDALRQMEERPWATACFGRGISSHRLAKLLKPFGISSRTIRFGDTTTAKGFYRDDLQEALQRYPLLPTSP